MTAVGIVDIVDKLKTDIEALAATPESSGGFSDVMSVNYIYVGDLPPFVAIEDYPIIEVAPITSEPAGGATQKVFRDLTIRVTLNYDPSAIEIEPDLEDAGVYEAMRVMESVERYLEKTAGTNLDGLCRKAEVSLTEYVPPLPRGTVNVRMATASIGVQIERPRSV